MINVYFLAKFSVYIRMYIDIFQDPCSPDDKKLGLKSTCSLSSTLYNKLKLFNTQDEASTLEEGFDDSSFDRSAC